MRDGHQGLVENVETYGIKPKNVNDGDRNCEDKPNAIMIPERTTRKRRKAFASSSLFARIWNTVKMTPNSVLTVNIVRAIYVQNILGDRNTAAVRTITYTYF